jgi:chemotaxis-related protein WspB
MIALIFEVAAQRYGLDISQVVEVVPAVRLRRLPGVPDYVAGVFRFRGAHVPVIDLSQLIGGTPAVPRLSTRLVLVRHPGPSGVGRLLGLLAERVADGLDDSASALVATGVAAPEAPYLGDLGTSGGRTIQYVRVEQLLPDALRERLFVEE